MRILLALMVALVLASVSHADQIARFGDDQWTASNASGICTISRLVSAAGQVTTVVIGYSSREGETPKGLRVSIGGRENIWPVRIELVDDLAARSFEIGGDPTVLPLLVGESAKTVLAHLQAGGEILVSYRSSTGDVRIPFGTEGFKQSNAMFEACVEAMSPNNALEQTRDG